MKVSRASQRKSLRSRCNTFCHWSAELTYRHIFRHASILQLRFSALVLRTASPIVTREVAASPKTRTFHFQQQRAEPNFATCRTEGRVWGTKLTGQRIHDPPDQRLLQGWPGKRIVLDQTPKLTDKSPKPSDWTTAKLKLF